MASYWTNIIILIHWRGLFRGFGRQRSPGVTLGACGARQEASDRSKRHLLEHSGLWGVVYVSLKTGRCEPETSVPYYILVYTSGTDWA